MNIDDEDIIFMLAIVCATLLICWSFTPSESGIKTPHGRCDCPCHLAKEK